jgi:ketosteroid isomerase-like protein
MSAEENKALVRRFYAEIDKGNIDAMDELVAGKRESGRRARKPGSYLNI